MIWQYTLPEVDLQVYHPFPGIIHTSLHRDKEERFERGNHSIPISSFANRCDNILQCLLIQGWDITGCLMERTALDHHTYQSMIVYSRYKRIMKYTTGCWLTTVHLLMQCRSDTGDWLITRHNVFSYILQPKLSGVRAYSSCCYKVVIIFFRNCRNISQIALLNVLKPFEIILCLNLYSSHSCFQVSQF